MALYAHALFDDLDVDVRPQWVGKGKESGLIIATAQQAISITLATTVGRFFFTLP